MRSEAEIRAELERLENLANTKSLGIQARKMELRWVLGEKEKFN